MITDDRDHWNKKYSSRTEKSEPSFFLVQTLNQPAWRVSTGRALDIATGKGRNALYLAERGFAVEGIDISDVALAEARREAKEKGLPVQFRSADLDHCDLPEAHYDLIVNFDFLQRLLVPKIKKALKVGGHIIFETYLIDQQDLGHPKNPAYLLGHNELLELFRDFRVLWYREGRFVQKGRETYRAGLFGRKI
jgi:SAM-dependent methyltransferase